MPRINVVRAVDVPLHASARAFASKSYTTAEALRVLEKHFSPAVARAPKGNNIVCADAKGCWVTDVSGRKYLDLQTGIGVANTGHSHPKVRLGRAGGNRPVPPRRRLTFSRVVCRSLLRSQSRRRRASTCSRTA